jgi:single-strand DNA-binding protein
MELTGKIKLINPTQSFDSGFSKREFVLTTKDQYPQDIKIEVVKDKCDLLNSFNPGDDIKVSINLKGNEYNGKYYVSIQGWKIERLEGVKEEDKSDLPF